MLTLARTTAFCIMLSWKQSWQNLLTLNFKILLMYNELTCSMDSSVLWQKWKLRLKRLRTQNFLLYHMRLHLKVWEEKKPYRLWITSSAILLHNFQPFVCIIFPFSEGRIFFFFKKKVCMLIVTKIVVEEVNFLDLSPVSPGYKTVDLNQMVDI